MNLYDIGDIATIQGTFTTHAGVAADPTTVTVEIINPAGTKTTYTDVTRVSTGVYTYDVSVTASGTYYYHFKGTGAVVAAGEGSFSVRKSKF